MPYILSVNAGSSSLKISLYEVCKTEGENPVTLILSSSITSISSPPAVVSLKHVDAKGGEENLDVSGQPVETITSHEAAFSHFLTLLNRSTLPTEKITHVCHRVVHGGDFGDPIEIGKEEFERIERLSDLAPLHNGAALSVIRTSVKYLPHAKSIAFFDTAFHRSIPVHIATYAIDQKIAKERGLKKYGFHGLSYAFIVRAVAKFLKKEPSTLNLIVLHLGSGASACAIKNGLSVDTSMGLTPLNGLPGATRSGSVDPSLIFHYTNQAGKMSHAKGAGDRLHVTEAEEILNTRSGWKALTGTTNFGVITKEADLGAESSTTCNNKNRLAFELFVDRVCNYIGSYYVKLGGNVDGLVFAGGIGEGSRELRAVVGEKVRCLGFVDVDVGKNEEVEEIEGDVIDIGVNGKGGKIFICRTDEQIEMARYCSLYVN